MINPISSIPDSSKRSIIIIKAGFSIPSVSMRGRKHFFTHFVAGKTLVPKPASGIIAFLIFWPGVRVKVNDGIPRFS